MNFIPYFFSQILFALFIISSIAEQSYDYSFGDIIEENSSITDETSTIMNTTSSSSIILEVLLTNYTPSVGTTTDQSTLIFSSPTSKEVQSIESLKSVIDQINSYRYTQIVSRIKQCDTNIKFKDICEIYSINNNTKSLQRQSDIEFNTFDDLFNGLVNRLIVEKLNKYCLFTNWCLSNLSENDIQVTNQMIQQRGYSFCLLEQCQTRLSLFIDSCPQLSNTNISQPTLKLLPMLCTLYNEQQYWNSSQCTEELVNVLHILYAFWPQIEACYDDISIGISSCTNECQTFDNILNKLDIQCNGAIAFLYQVPVLAWYQSINLTEICHQKRFPTRSPFIYSIKKFVSSHNFWYRFYDKPLYTSSFLIIIIISFVISLSFCCYLKSKHRSNPDYRRYDNNNYEYTRLNNSSFELGTTSEIPNTNSTINGTIDDDDESQYGANDRSRSAEYQRLLFVNS